MLFPRRLRSLVTVLAFQTIALGSVPNARAQAVPQPPATTPSAADAATAKKHFESGLKLFGEQAYAEALIAFESSYKLGGRPSALKNIAQCQRNLRHFVEAYEAYEQLLALHDAQLTPADRSAFKQALEELSLLTVTLTVSVNEAGAAIELDGKPFGTSPLPKPKRMTVAEHRLRVTKAGFGPFEQTISARSGHDERVDVKLAVEVAAGHVAIREQSGREVHVFVDGEDRGKAPWEGELPEGDHAIELKGAKFGSEKRTITVAKGGRTEVALDAAPTTGHLRVTTLPASARIAIDGASVGTGSYDGDLAPGSHRIEVSVEGAPSAMREVVVSRGETIVQEIPLVTATGEAPPDYRGVYARLAIEPLFPISKPPTNAGNGSRREDKFHLGAGGDLRIGYAFDWLGVEAVGRFVFEHRDEALSYPPPIGTSGNARYRFESNGANFFFGVGPRVTSKDKSIRFTFGLAPGLALRNFNVQRHSDGDNNCSNSGGNCTNTPDQEFKATGYTAFALSADGGILFGSSPGAKFFLGLHSWLDFPPGDIQVGPDLSETPLSRPNRAYGVVDSVQLFIGPVLGLQVGH
jgi:hypothetical protein